MLNTKATSMPKNHLDQITVFCFKARVEAESWFITLEVIKLISVLPKEALFCSMCPNVFSGYYCILILNQLSFNCSLPRGSVFFFFLKNDKVAIGLFWVFLIVISHWGKEWASSLHAKAGKFLQLCYKVAKSIHLMRYRNRFSF